MSDGLFAAASGARATERALEVLANNLANLSTAGYKAQEITYREVIPEGENAMQRLVDIEGVLDDLSQGRLNETHNPLDVALDGPGFFVVDADGQERLSRGGGLQIDREGTLVDSLGRQMLSAGGPIYVAGRGTITIGAEAEVLGDGQLLGQLRVVKPNSEATLERLGEGLWAVNGELEEATTQVRSGFLERSNVNVMDQMAQMVWTVRAHQVYQRSLEIMSSVDEKTANELTG